MTFQRIKMDKRYYLQTLIKCRILGFRLVSQFIFPYSTKQDLPRILRFFTISCFVDACVGVAVGVRVRWCIVNW